MNSKGKLEPSKLVTLDFETYYSDTYTLSGKTLNTSEYIRSPEFKVHCVGIKVGRGKTKWYDSKTAKRGIQSIDWSTHDLLCQNTAFDGLILSEHYGVVPRFYYDTLSMSRALHGVCMRHDLGTISKAYGRGGKIEGALVKTKGKRELTEDELEALAYYCCNDVDETYEIFRLMVEHFPKDELELIDLTIRMFCDPVLEVDVTACEELRDLEMQEKERLIELAGVPREVLSSNNKFAEQLRQYGIDPPIKISLKTGNETYAFAKTDPEFEALLDHEDHRVIALAEARLAVKSTINETRAQRFINAGTTGKLPVGYNYCGAHTHRWSGSNKLNMQNLKRV